MEPLIIEYSSELYPEKLKEIKNPPSRLYALGNVRLLNEIGIAVIGSRSFSQYGEKMCKRFVKNLVEYNINIISGLAHGIDSFAHETCLKNSGKTIAVLPSGLKNICSATNKKLINEILENNGVIISEYENDIIANSERFLERNRIVAGLGIGTLVVEAGYRSGTTVTARFTEENKKPVFCIPSSLENLKGQATNWLIKRGAKLITSVEDILKEIHKINPELNFKKKETEKKNININISKDLLEIYKVLNNIPKDINEIIRETKLPVNEVNYKIMMLQLDDRIIELPGQRFITNERE